MPVARYHLLGYEATCMTEARYCRVSWTLQRGLFYSHCTCEYQCIIYHLQVSCGYVIPLSVTVATFILLTVFPFPSGFWEKNEKKRKKKLALRNNLKIKFLEIHGNSQTYCAVGVYIWGKLEWGFATKTLKTRSSLLPRPSSAGRS